MNGASILIALIFGVVLAQACTDDSKLCPTWKRLCSKYSFVKQKCPKTCGVCEGGQQTSDGDEKTDPQKTFNSNDGGGSLTCVYDNPLEGAKYDNKCPEGTTECGTFKCTIFGRTFVGKNCNLDNDFCNKGNSRCPGIGECKLCKGNRCNG